MATSIAYGVCALGPAVGFAAATFVKHSADFERLLNDESFLSKVTEKWGSCSASEVIYYLEDHCSNTEELRKAGRLSEFELQTEDQIFAIYGIVLHFEGRNSWPNFQLHLTAKPTPSAPQPWPASEYTLEQLGTKIIVP